MSDYPIPIYTGGDDIYTTPAAVPYLGIYPAPPAPTLTAPASGGGVYVVQRGDTLARIAATYHTTAQAIAQANGISNINLIYVGQRLTIPGASAAAPNQTLVSNAQGGNPNNPGGEPPKKTDYSGLLLIGGVALLLIVALSKD
jgi:LysM repeat protein